MVWAANYTMIPLKKISVAFYTFKMHGNGVPGVQWYNFAEFDGV
jgi:hypothetical protein